MKRRSTNHAPRTTKSKKRGPWPVARGSIFKCYLNGEEIKERGLLPALSEDEISVFESLRVYNRRAFRLKEHIQRLMASAKSCGVELPDFLILDSWLRKALVSSNMSDGFIRLTVWQGQLYLMTGSRKHNSEIYEKGVDLKTSSFRMPSPKESDVQSKTGNYRLQILATEPRAPSPEALGPPASGLRAFEYLFLDENHFLTESRVGNFFMVRSNSKQTLVLTPPSHAVLNGITREVVIECARELGFLVRETPLTRHEVFNADEAFLTNTSWEILPVRSLDGRLVKEAIPGPVTKKLIKCFHRKVQIACHPEKSSARSSPFRTKKA